MLADAPWTTWLKISWSPQDILPAGMNVLLANAECRNPPPAPASTFKSHTFFPGIKKKPSQAHKPGKVSTINDLPVITFAGLKALAAIYRFFTRRSERNSRIFSASSSNGWEHLAFLTAIATAALISCLCFFSCTALSATSRFVSEPFFSIEKGCSKLTETMAHFDLAYSRCMGYYIITGFNKHTYYKGSTSS